MLDALAEKLKFTFNIRSPKDGQFWGYAHPNGSAIGMVGEVYHEVADMSMCNQYVVPYKHIKFVYPYTIDRATYLVRIMILFLPI